MCSPVIINANIREREKRGWDGGAERKEDGREESGREGKCEDRKRGELGQ